MRRKGAFTWAKAFERREMVLKEKNLKEKVLRKGFG